MKNQIASPSSLKIDFFQNELLEKRFQREIRGERWEGHGEGAEMLSGQEGGEEGGAGVERRQECWARGHSGALAGLAAAPQARPRQSHHPPPHRPSGPSPGAWCGGLWEVPT